MKTEFDEWFADTFDERDIDDESLYSIAKKAWDEAMNRGAGHGKECATKAMEQNGHIAQQTNG